jgi:phosphoglycerate kinase
MLLQFVYIFYSELLCGGVQLAGLADVYVNDAFGSWQAHTSTYHVAKYLPSFAGLYMQVIFLQLSISTFNFSTTFNFFLMPFCSFKMTLLCLQDELSNVRAVLDPKRPFVAIVAGTKYDTKIGPLTAVYKRVDHLVLDGLIYNTFLCAKYGVKIKGVEVRTNLLNLCSSSTPCPL